MKGNFLVFLAAALTVFTGAARAAAPECSLSASEISKEIHDKGAREMLRGLPGSSFDYSGYFHLMACLRTGEKEWLDISVPLVTELQPDPEDDIPDAIQNVLAINPEMVLSEPWPSSFTISDYICTVAVDDHDTFDESIADLDRRVKAVKMIRNPSLKTKVTECLAGFEKSKQELRRVFEVDKGSNPGTAPTSFDLSNASEPPN